MIITKAKTALALGLVNLVRVLCYRLGIKLGLNPVKKISATIESSVFFTAVDKQCLVDLPVNKQWINQQSYFGWKVRQSAAIPDWHYSVLTEQSVQQPLRNWWQIADFDDRLGDIKGVWEASRFDWVLSLAQAAATGDSSAINKLNDWLLDWCNNNPPYCGVNWKCGQEASLRVLHLAMAAVILQQHANPAAGMVELIKAHLQRIMPTISYAMAQDNNHGTSEAAALFIGGSWLTLTGDASGERYYQKGRSWLENRAAKLIEKDGGFSQYSTTYHRVMLDTYAMAEVWRMKLKLPSFSRALYAKLTAATNWLYQFTQLDCGDAPNLGANDGARLLPLTSCDYRDFRPSVQLAAVLFTKARALEQTGDWDLPAKWLGLARPEANLPNQLSTHFEQSGYFTLRTARCYVMLNYPKYRFRPSQSDALHLDFWLDGDNLLRDGGTYSYNAGQAFIDYFGGVQSHNTVEFDHRDQMPRLSRFLLGDWLTCYQVQSITKNASSSNNAQQCQAGYKDAKQATHIRQVKLTDKTLTVVDNVSGFNDKAVLRWRLNNSDWKIDGNSVTNGIHTLSVTANVQIKRFEITKGWESRYYFDKQEITVLEVEVSQAALLTSIYNFESSITL